MSDRLEPMRRKIEEIDSKIVKLMIERNDTAKKVGEVKKELGISVRNREVEEAVVRRYRAAAEGTTLSADAAEAVCRLLIAHSVELQSVILRKRCERKVTIIGGAGKMGQWMSRYFESMGATVNIVDIGDGDLKDLRDPDIVVISVPIPATSGILNDLDRVCGDNTLIFDIASIKSPFASVLKEMAKRKKVCSVHPMFGPSALSMTGRNVIICDCGCKEAVAEATEIFGNDNPDITVIPLERHDELMTYVLAFAHASNIAFFSTLRRSGIPFKELRKVSSTTFERTMNASMPVSRESGLFYHYIQHHNANAEIMWDAFEDAVRELREASLSEDPKRFAEIMEKGKAYLDARDNS